jgi:hypothetical protein
MATTVGDRARCGSIGIVSAVLSMSVICGSAAADPLETLHAAALLAGSGVTGLPIVLAPARVSEVSANAEAWTTHDASGRPVWIVVAADTAVFRCAMPPRKSHQCLLKLASILRHEAWHFRFGADERQAYEEQIRFLQLRGASPYTVTGVLRARNHVMARQRRGDVK